MRCSNWKKSIVERRVSKKDYSWVSLISTENAYWALISLFMLVWDTCNLKGQLERAVGKNEKLVTFELESSNWNWKEWSWKVRAEVGNFQ